MPAINLLGYQDKCFRDRSRFKALMWARGARKTFNVTLEIVDECFEVESKSKRTDWLIGSRGERQALEAMREIKRHCRVYDMAASDIEEREVWGQIEAKAFKVYEVTLPLGSRVMAVSSSPDSMVGYTSNVYLDEFALHKDSRAVWNAVYPVLRGRLRMIVSSTPRGKSNKFHEIITSEDGIWSKHIVDIYDAVAQGLPFDIDLERRAMSDPDAWAQEYELKWLDEASAWLDYDLIAACEVDCQREKLHDDRVTIFRRPVPDGRLSFYLGWDVARFRDLSVIWVIGLCDGIAHVAEVVAMRGLNFKEQFEEFDRVMEFYKVVRACLDQTGMGIPVVEEAKERHGEYAIEGVTFANSTKQELAVSIKQRFEDRRLTVPIDSDVRDSLHSVRKTVTSAGNFRFDADRSEIGHGDHFWALALADHAIGGITPIDFGVVETTDEYADFDSQINWRGY